MRFVIFFYAGTSNEGPVRITSQALKTTVPPPPDSDVPAPWSPSTNQRKAQRLTIKGLRGYEPE